MSTTTVQTRVYSGPPLWAMCGPARILLKPTRTSLLLLCPLLSTQKPLDPLALPAEVWSKVFVFAMNLDETERDQKLVLEARRNFVIVCKAFKNMATPILYAQPTLSSPNNLFRFATTLIDADQQWDSLRRIPFSTPGRWVTSLDLSSITLNQAHQLKFDSALTQVFPLVPHLSKLALNPQIILSRRALNSLRDSCGPYLKMITGLRVSDVAHAWPGQIDPVCSLLMNTPKLEILEVLGGGIGDADEDPINTDVAPISSPLADATEMVELANLHTLSIVAAPHAPIVNMLIEVPLPSLQFLTLTCYHRYQEDDQLAAAIALGLVPGSTPPVPAATSTLKFLSAHGSRLTSLVLLSAPDWPPVAFTPPSNILQLAPNLHHLILECKSSSPLLYTLGFETLTSPHPLKVLIMSRPPAHEDGVLRFLEECVRGKAKDMKGRNTGSVSRSPSAPVRNNTAARPSASPDRSEKSTALVSYRPADLKGPEALLPDLHTVQFTAVKWLRLKGARHTGHTAGMREWKGTLRRWGVRVLDQSGKDE